MGVGIQIAAFGSLILGYALLLILAIRQRIGHGRAQRLLEATLLLAALWTVTLAWPMLLAPSGWWAFVWHRMGQIGLVVLAWLTAEFAEAFVDRQSRRWPRWAMVLAMSLTAVMLDIRPVPWLDSGSLLPFVRLGPTELATLLLFGAWALSTAAAWATGAWALRRAVGSKHRNRIRYLRTTLVCFALADLLIFFGGMPGVYVGLVARLAGFALLTFAVLRFDLPDIKRLSLVLVRLAVMVGFTAGLFLAILLVAGLVVGGLDNLSDLPVLFPALVLAVLVAAGAEVALAPRLQRFLDRTVLGQSYDVQKALRAYSQQISLILDLERLAAATLEWLQATMRVERSAFILFSAQSGGQIEMRALRATMSPLPLPQTFAADSRFVLHFRNISRPLSQYDLDMLSWFQVMHPDERRWLKALAVDLYVPVLVADKPVALLALGPKADGQPYSPEDLETLIILAGLTGTAVDNARLVDDLRAVRADLHNLDTELEETNRQLKRLDQAKADFVTIASHELRTPLSQIYGYSDVLASMEGDELGDSQMVQEFIERIARGARRLKLVVDAMVDMSLLETGALKMQFDAVSLSEVIDYVVQTAQANAARRNLTITARDLAGLPAIRADGERLAQVFASLLRNAIKFSRDDSEILISGHLVSPSPNEKCVEVLVADHGIGIDPDQKALIFEKFYRPEDPLLHSTDDVRFKGAGPGLGLAIARGIVEAHGGRIWAESPGRDEEACPGSTFYVRLPVNGPAEG